jgi:hypothetical protein
MAFIFRSKKPTRSEPELSKSLEVILDPQTTQQNNNAIGCFDLDIDGSRGLAASPQQW